VLEDTRSRPGDLLVRVVATEERVDISVSSYSTYVIRVLQQSQWGVAVGPLGRGAQSAVHSGDWTVHLTYAYGRQQGIFVGMSVEGSVVRVREDVNGLLWTPMPSGWFVADARIQSGGTAPHALEWALQPIPRPDSQPPDAGSFLIINTVLFFRQLFRTLLLKVRRNLESLEQQREE
jgi:hypothetical protein